MFLFNFIKFFGTFVFVLVISSACRSCQKTENAPPPTSEELKSEIPFSTKEPEIFRTEIVITADRRESKLRAARRGAARRIDYNFETKNQFSILQTDKNYRLIESQKVYAEAPGENTGATENWTSFLTTEWLNAKADAKFFKQGAQDNLTIYRVVFGASEKSESLIFIDESLGLPVKQEFYSLEGEQKILTMTIELKNLKLDAESWLFEIPKDFRKISQEEFAAILKKENE